MTTKSARLIAGMSVGLLGAVLPLQAQASGGAVAEIDVTYDCDSSEWTFTSSKAISNVVVFDGSEYMKYEFYDGYGEMYTWTISDDHVETVWVKSGNNKSGDGPGFGERFDLETPYCGVS